MNRSFANALIVPLFVRYGEAVLGKLRFRHCNAIVELMLKSALSMGEKAARRQRV